MTRLIPLIILTVLTLISSSQSFAQGRFYQWNSGAAAAPILIYVPDNKSPTTLANKYLRQLLKHPDLAEIFSGRQPAIGEISEGDFTALTNEQALKTALLISNNESDLDNQSQRIYNFKNSLFYARLSTMILPMRWDLVLSVKEFRDFKDKVANEIPMLIAMGGEDVHPALYGAENLYAHNVIHSRDVYEISFIKKYIEAQKGFLLGICRGHQIASVALGYQLTQDVPSMHGDEVSHANHEHPIKILATTHSILKSALNKFGTSKLGQTKIGNVARVVVNSLHHQAVRFLSDRGYTAKRTDLELAAISDDGVVEALEFKNGKGLLLQFHPERMHNHWVNKSIFSYIGEKVRDRKIYSCNKIY